ncbi:hypothetical protein BJ742DRAFT_29376 [Cladochytrium replicatum]|nr:hypothetical protein BJ742DRAFT_29376 [Cladochytrium replicatum]
MSSKKLKVPNDRRPSKRRVGADSPEQAILDVINATCASATSSPDFDTRLRSIKDLFKERNYDAIFNEKLNLPVYIAEYAPGRALCYHHIIQANQVLKELVQRKGGYIYALGAGAGSELVGIAAALAYRRGEYTDTQSDGDGPSELGERRASVKERGGRIVTRGGKGNASTDGNGGGSDVSSETVHEAPAPTTRLELHCQDMADYQPTIGDLYTTALNHWGKLYAGDMSADPATRNCARRSLQPFPPAELNFEYSVGNALDPSADITSSIRKADLITSMFVLNELFAHSKAAVVKLIELLVREMRPGSHLLVVESAGSFSNVQIGSAAREYRVHDLLDRLKDFEIVEETDSEWYRFPEGLEYPRKLNSMRYFLRLYRRKE